MTNLPVFSTFARPAVDIDVDRLTHGILAGRDTTVRTRGGQVSVRGPDHVVDIDAGRGGVWAADTARLWRDEEMRAPEAGDAAKIAEQAMEDVRLVPDLGKHFRLLDGRVRYGNRVTEAEGKRSVAQAEAVYSRDVVVDLGIKDDRVGGPLPLFGGGGKFSTTVGDEGAVLAMAGAWRHAEPVDEAELLDFDAAADRAGLKRSDDFRVRGAKLGYYSAPAFKGQSLMFPVYAVSADVRAGDDWVPSRVRLIPATDVGTVNEPEVHRRTRKSGRDKFSGLKSVLKRGAQIPSGLTIDRKALDARKINIADVATRGPNGAWTVKPLLSDALIKALLEAIRPRAFGASWIGEFGGLGGSLKNAQGFVDEMGAEGWQERFNWGNQDAWKSDWVSNDDDYVDDVDFVFYTGHAGPDGWMLASNGEGDWIHFSEVGTSPNMPSDLWGQENLEWVVIAACGPLQDDIINGGGNVFDRWRAAFDGLHLMMGYAAVTFDNEEEGKRLASYARSGMTLRQAWFRTAQEIQPSTNDEGDPYGPDVFAATMYIGNSSGHTGDDHLWGHGSVGRDIRGPSYRVCHFSPC